MNSTSFDETLFDWAEYSVFSLMLATSSVIGLYFGCFKQQDSVSEYLLGGKRMGMVPVAVSLVSSYISGVTLLGVPTEIYTYGTQFFLANVTNAFVGGVTATLFLPVFYKLQLVSLYEYLERRFNYKIRVIASLLNALSLITFVPIVIYGPALAFNQVSGANIHIITAVLCAVCIFYTTLGGLRAVVWTDTLQGFLMLCSAIAVLVLGFNSVGGFTKVLDAAQEGGRIEFLVMDPDPTLRMSFWSVTFGLFFTWTAQLAVNPGVVQRFISVSSYRQAYRSIILMTIGVIIFAILSMTLGLVMYTAYQSCDPLTAKIISRRDQILPLFVTNVAKQVRGLPGLFIAGIVSAALSTMSTSLNTIAGTVFEDFISPFLPPKIREEYAGKIMRIIVLVTGAICVLMVMVIENMGQILEMASSFGGVTTGTSLGIFILGILFPCANTPGAFVGGLFSISLMTWIMAGNQVAAVKGLLKYPVKPMRVDGCQSFVNLTSMASVEAVEQVFWPFRISVFHYGLIGCLSVLVIGIPVSLLTPGIRPKTNPELFSPWVRRWLPEDGETCSIPLDEQHTEYKTA
ncbi:sodium-coupled monocarboxylate transporter 2-like isoform X2 [Cimex lectularius]|nr:sodium-coupled monocarboxylate transporter 2-like isoform X2 [Cimex lectularius]XP_024083520.1 sodium-coupled monocarboxylate transporter 2-like isoform X2 [Cimex lectularius]